MAQIGSFALLLALALAAYSFLVGMIALFFQDKPLEVWSRGRAVGLAGQPHRCRMRRSPQGRDPAR